MKIVAYVLKFLLLALFLFSASGKLIGNADVAAGFAHFGFDSKWALPFGVIELVSAILFVIPSRFEIIGAILLTGYMGGAIATHLRVGEPPIMQAVVPFLIWVAYALRNPGIVKAVFSSKS